MDGFLNFIQSIGWNPPNTIIADGRIHRFPTDASKRTKKDGWYIYHDGDIGVGIVGSWRDNAQFKYVDKPHLTQEEKLTVNKKWREQRAAYEKQQKLEREQAKKKAKEIYAAAKPAQTHPYIEKKGINMPASGRVINNGRIFGLKGACLIFPVYDENGEITSLQGIDADGNKRFLKGGKMKGGHLPLGAEPEQAKGLIFAEGVATAQSIFEAFSKQDQARITVFACFSSGQIPVVAKQYHLKYTDKTIIIAIDHDDAGEKAGKAVLKLIPTANLVKPKQKGNDFNDEVFPASDIKLDRQDWRKDLTINTKKDGSETIAATLHNYLQILRNHPQFIGRIKKNEMSSFPEIDGEMMTDITLTKIRAEIEAIIGSSTRANDVASAIAFIANENPYHPIKEKLEGLEWDGVSRIDKLFIKYCGTEDTPYYRGAAIYFFMSALNRLYNPGCKVDMMITLESPQGWRKSTFWEVMSLGFYADNLDTIGDKDFHIGIQGVWIVDMGELAQFSKSDVKKIKQVITVRKDRFREPYAKTHTEHLRQCVFVGGTNDDEWIKDPSGGRRFLPIRLEKPIDIAEFEKEVEQMWAEAMSYLRGKIIENWWDVPDAEKHQRERIEQDPLHEKIEDYVSGKAVVHIPDIMSEVMGLEEKEMTKREQNRVRDVLKLLGYSTHPVKINGRVKRRWVKREGGNSVT